ncbi:MAG: triose-phosphate isomerase [Actinomycetota bacterium]|nr:triose-phosphate isomerase [Actinomycetota bacterium]MDQ2959137.1 triose-phosphate isomerase [Actinomycetota bacterium]
MNLNHYEAIALVQKIAFSLKPQHFDAVEVTVLPPFTDIRSVQTLVDGDKLRLSYGAQDLSPQVGGAYTGDIAGSMLAKLGCSYVVIGHSERREYHAETDQLVNAKIKAAYANGLVPILCVGERLEVREAGGQVEHCVDQLTAALAGIGAEQAASIVIAYEPVWAIGTGKVATPADAQQVCAAVRTQLGELYSPELGAGVRILYGGSVKSTNAAEILAQPDVDGALVGGASLDGAEFAGICVAAAGGPFTG